MEFKVTVQIKPLISAESSTQSIFKSESDFDPIFLEKEVTISSQQTLLSALLENKIKIDSSCGGHATCGTCRIFLLKGEIKNRNEQELEFFSDRQMEDFERLSCQSYVKSDILIRIN